LVADCAHTTAVVARFLALLELYREGAITFDQQDALGVLRVRCGGERPIQLASDEEWT